MTILDAIERRECNIAHGVYDYCRHNEYGVTEIYYRIDVTSKYFALLPITWAGTILYVGDQIFNDG